MTAETLHDAISLLPADLIAEADKQRTAPRPAIRWQRYAAMAACFVLMVCGSVWCLHNLGLGGVREAANEAPAAVMQGAPEIMEAAEEAPWEAACDAAPDTCIGAGESSNSACTATTPSVTLKIEGHAYLLTTEDGSAVAQLLLSLDFRKEDICECITEITAVIGDTAEYHINLEEGFVRGTEGQASLAQAQIDLLRNILNALLS